MITELVVRAFLTNTACAGPGATIPTPSDLDYQ